MAPCPIHLPPLGGSRYELVQICKEGTCVCTVPPKGCNICDGINGGFTVVSLPSLKKKHQNCVFFFLLGTEQQNKLYLRSDIDVGPLKCSSNIRSWTWNFKIVSSGSVRVYWFKIQLPSVNVISSKLTISHQPGNFPETVRHYHVFGWTSSRHQRFFA